MTDVPGSSHTSDVDETRGVGWRFALTFAAATTVLLVGVLIALNVAGTGARAVPASAPAVIVVDDAKDLLSTWNQRGVHGAALVYVTRTLGYALPEEVFQHATGLPVPLLDLRHVFRNNATAPSVVWVASHTGPVRSVTYVLTPQDLAEKVQVGRQNGWPGIAADGTYIRASDEEGFVRIVSTEIPSTTLDAAILHIDASYFINGTPEELSEQLSRSQQSFGLVTLSRSVDATDVPDAARVRLDRMAELLREQAPK